MTRHSFLVAAVLPVFGLGAACGGGGGGGGIAVHATQPAGTGGSAHSASAGLVSPSSIQAGSATNDPQWQTALAALAQAATPDPVRLEQASLAVWNDFIARTWRRFLPLVLPVIDQQLRSVVGTGAGGITITGLRNVSIDIAAPPTMIASAPGPQQTLMLHLPNPQDTWSIRGTVDVGGNIRVQLAGISTTIHVAAEVNVEVTDIRVDEPIDLDLTNPTAPQIVGSGTPSINLTLALSSGTPLLSTITQALSQILDPVIRVALTAGSVVARQQIGLALYSVTQGPTFGLGGPTVRTVSNLTPLQPLADTISDEIQTHHMPYDHVYPAKFDQPHQGGALLAYESYGDSAIWTGHYLAAEAYRFDVSGDQRALAGATRAVAGIGLLLEIAIPGGGLLARAAMPMSSPHMAGFQGSSSFYTGWANGQAYGAIDNISRDQYIGVMLGLGQAYHRIPGLRTDARRLVSRVIHYLESHDWVAYKPNGVWPNETVGSTPLGEPTRWTGLHRAYSALSELIWLHTWTSAREVHESYYKFNLWHANHASLFELETDPALYRAYLRSLRVVRETIGHHQNAWFDAVYGMALPSLTQTVGQLVEKELDLFALRPRRGFTVTNSQDPAIQTTTYTINMPNQGGTPGSQMVTQPRVKTVALHPIPIDKRRHAGFLWQSSPFELDGGNSPYLQEPGIDLLLPYWLARSHGMIR
ncbi:hypothetical protein ACFL59_15905 [Planctomycetota bacterium]